MSLGQEYEEAAMALASDPIVSEHGSYALYPTGDFQLDEAMLKEVMGIFMLRSDAKFISHDRIVVEMDDEYAIFTFTPTENKGAILSTWVVVDKNRGAFASPPIGYIRSIYRLVFRYATPLKPMKTAGISFYKAATRAQLSQVYASLRSYRMPVNVSIPCLVVVRDPYYPPSEDDIIDAKKLEALSEFING